MASGRYDYWHGMLPGRAEIADNQSSWYIYDSADLASLVNYYLYTYTVPVGYVLYVQGGVISAEHPGIKGVIFYIDSDIVTRFMFDTIQIINIGVDSIWVLNEGEQFKIRVYNYDTITNTFFVSMVGFLEYKIG